MLTRTLHLLHVVGIDSTCTRPLNNFFTFENIPVRKFWPGISFRQWRRRGDCSRRGARRDLAAESRSPPSLPPFPASVVPSSVRVRPSLWRGRRPPRRGCVGGFEADGDGGGGEEVNGGRARRQPMELFKREGPGIGRKGKGQRMTDRGSRT